MKAVRLVAGFALVLGLAGCGGSSQGSDAKTVMPDVEGKRLDVAKSDIERAGFEGDVEIVGGGTLGVVVESNWTVCEQLPAAGKTVTAAPRLTVDRSCKTDTPTTTTTAKTTTTAVPTTSATTSKPSTPTTTTATANAAAMEQAYLRHLADNGITSIEAMCDAAYTHWACFYTGASDGPGDLRVTLVTDGGRSAADLDTMARQAGLAWFNFIGCDFPSLSTIVVTVNGIDHNVLRGDSAADVAC